MHKEKEFIGWGFVYVSQKDNFAACIYKHSNLVNLLWAVLIFLGNTTKN